MGIGLGMGMGMGMGRTGRDPLARLGDRLPALRRDGIRRRRREEQVVLLLQGLDLARLPLHVAQLRQRPRRARHAPGPMPQRSSPRAIVGFVRRGLALVGKVPTAPQRADDPIMQDACESEHVRVTQRRSLVELGPGQGALDGIDPIEDQSACSSSVGRCLMLTST